MLDSAWTILSETSRFAQVQLEKLDDDNWDVDDDDEKDQDGAESHSQHYDFAASLKFVWFSRTLKKSSRLNQRIINDTNAISPHPFGIQLSLLLKMILNRLTL